MRLWSVHPRYLDPQGLVALWREGLLARHVLHGLTNGYRNHPQLNRFKAHATPQLAIDAYLWAVQQQATERGYRFDSSKLGPNSAVAPIAVTSGQMAYEWEHLLRKLQARNPALWEQWRHTTDPQCHPLLQPGPGPIADWERPEP